MNNKSAGTILLLGALALFGPVISHAMNVGPGTMIETQPYETDDHITASAQQLFAADKLLKDQDIKINTRHAIVDLTGTVSSKEESDRAAAMVTRIPAVHKVHNKLKVNPG